MDKVIGYKDAAEKIENMTLWKSAAGNYYLDEAAARNDGMTHSQCKNCQALIKKYRLLCEGCKEEKDKERYSEMPKKEWNGKDVLYSDKNDQYFSSFEEAEDILEIGETLNDLRLIICEPNCPNLTSDYFEHIRADGYDLPYALECAINEFNESVKNVICSWSPGDFAVLLENKR